MDQLVGMEKFLDKGPESPKKTKKIVSIKEKKKLPQKKTGNELKKEFNEPKKTALVEEVNQVQPTGQESKISKEEKYDPAEPADNVDTTDEKPYNAEDEQKDDVPYKPENDENSDDKMLKSYSPNIIFISGNICKYGSWVVATVVSNDRKGQGEKPVLDTQTPLTYSISGGSRRQRSNINFLINFISLIISLSISSRPKPRLTPRPDAQLREQEGGHHGSLTL